MTTSSARALDKLTAVDTHYNDLHYSVRRYHVDSFLFRHAGVIHGRVLDLGGLRTSKRGQFDLNAFAPDALYINLAVSRKPHVAGDAERLPLLDASVDTVICGEVLEHLPRPHTALRECHRVLRTGGLLLATAPFLFPVHGDPDDYGRYTASFWKMALADAGFDPFEVEPQGGFYSVGADMLKTWLRETRNRDWRYWLARKLLPRTVKWALQKDLWLAAQPDSNLSRFTTGFGIVARRA